MAQKGWSMLKGGTVVNSSGSAHLYFEILREDHAHAGVQGIMIWGTWTPTRCYRMCLTDNNFKNLPTGDVVNKLMSEWGRPTSLKGTTDSNGHFETSLFHGDSKFQCLTKPEEAHYGGGIVLNPELNLGLKGWTIFGDAKVEHQKSKDGKKYIVASNRNTAFDSFTQKFCLEKDKLYVFSAWFSVSQGNAHIAAKFKTKTGDETAGWVMAKKGCWSMLKVHKSKVKFQAVDQQGKALANATITIKQNLPGFPLGCTMNPLILDNTAYEKWFTPKFRYTVFENELKWYMNEPSRGKEDYGPADAMLKFAKANNIKVRGHNLFWDNPKLQPNWVGGLSTDDLRVVTDHRINYVMSRYLGQMIHWDVVNENLHYSFFEDKFGANASTIFYEKANQIDGNTIPFLNDFNTIEESEGLASPAKYLAKISQIREEGYNGPLGIGLEGHFTVPNLPYIRASLDQLSSANLPIWLTEMDVDSRPDQVRDSRF
ncbi:unnamed protein product [Fraxinus pennsylvanica]|uniref:GH10 domain-containing protein n=1 Tax=Fraxinus pennsylvanica TaxID=56036 RepID=A0AAD1ZJ17_9LAMI|nr:unnamed protein product [Fraxinus pennsylvanica]